MEIVDENSEPLEPLGGKRGRPPTRDWSLWLIPGKTVRLTQGVDFTCSQASLRTQVYSAASARGGHARVSFGQRKGRLTAEVFFYVKTTTHVPEVIDDSGTSSGLTEDEIEQMYEEMRPAPQRHRSFLNDDDDLGPEPPRPSAVSDDDIEEFEETGTYGRDSIPERPGQWGPSHS